jgi:zinc/manganese transport system substrate-binding protein
MKYPVLALCSFLLLPSLAEAKLLQIVASTADLAAIAREVAGAEGDVDSIAKGTQDPHFIEAKPSYMVKLSRADLLVTVGLELEIGWIPSLVRGARNPRVKSGERGFLEVGHLVDPIEIPTAKVTRAEGDVHPAGNPHVTLDPLRAGRIAGLIAGRLSELDPAHAAEFAMRAASFAERMKTKTEAWRKRIEKSGVRKVVTYHRTLTYFFDRFGLENPAILEPKPGIPPTSGHIIEVIQLMKRQKIPLVMVENFFDASVTKKITGEIPGSRSVTVAVAVGGEENIRSLDDLYEQLVKAVEGK